MEIIANPYGNIKKGKFYRRLDNESFEMITDEGNISKIYDWEVIPQED